MKKTKKNYFSLFFEEVLNVSGNNLDSLAELSCLEKLQELTASNNNLENLRELVQLLSMWTCLKQIDTSRNPICSKARYRERLIVVSTSLGNLIDEKCFISFQYNYMENRNA